MRQFPIKKIIKHLQANDILSDHEDYESFEVICSDEITFLKDYISKEDLNAFLINMAIMYVNQGILYAKHNLSARKFKEYAIWFSVDIEDFFPREIGHYFVEAHYTRRASVVFHDLLDKPFDIRKNAEFNKIAKTVNGLSDFYCTEMKCLDEVVYSFIPKFFVDRYRETLNSDKCK